MDATLHLYSKAEIIFVWSNLLTKGHCAVLKTKHSIFIQALSLHTWRKKNSVSAIKTYFYVYLDTAVMQRYVFIHL